MCEHVELKYSTWNMYIAEQNGCAQCAHSCKKTDEVWHCTCGQGYTLSSDGKSCTGTLRLIILTILVSLAKGEGIAFIFVTCEKSKIFKVYWLVECVIGPIRRIALIIACVCLRVCVCVCLLARSEGLPLLLPAFVCLCV